METAVAKFCYQIVQYDPILLDNIYGIVYVRMYRFGCIVTIRGSNNGFAIVKTINNDWSAPLPVTIGGIAIGADIGIEATDFIILLRTPLAAEGFITNGFRGGLNVCIALGPIGKTGEVMMSSGSNESVTILAQSKGLYGGVSLEIGGFNIDKGKSFYLYGHSPSYDELINNKIEKPSFSFPIYTTLSKIQNGHYSKFPTRKVNQNQNGNGNGNLKKDDLIVGRDELIDPIPISKENEYTL